MSHKTLQRQKPIPISTARTAWGLLQAVKRAIRADPLRVDMRRFYGHCGPEEGGPACGTVGCFAGWVNILAGYRGGNYEDAQAKMLLGPTLDYYLASGAHVFNSGYGDQCAVTRTGSKAHADALVARIDRFMRRNAPALKARRLKPSPGGRMLISRASR